LLGWKAKDPLLFFNKNGVAIIWLGRKTMSTAKEQERQQRMEWAYIKRRGHFRFVMEFIFGMIGLMAFIEVVWHLLAKTVGRNYLLDTMPDIVGFGCITGFVIAELGWFYMKRKFRIPPPEEDWMAK
jgi:hypothetical protein